MKTNDYLATFTGRRLGAIGVMQAMRVIISSPNEETARKAINDSFDHVVGLFIAPLVSAQYATEERHLRTCVFRPYLKGKGPTFRLDLWDTFKRDHHGKSLLAYRLTQYEAGKRTVLFDGADMACSPCHAVDSDSTIAQLMGFLCLRLGDTDREYFDNYAPTQEEFRDTHAETLSCLVFDRFTDEGRDGR